jgi:hypothetical protein
MRASRRHTSQSRARDGEDCRARRLTLVTITSALRCTSLVVARTVPRPTGDEDEFLSYNIAEGTQTVYERSEGVLDRFTFSHLRRPVVKMTPPR